MVVLDIQLDNFYAFKNFHMNLTYPKKIVGSSIKDEHLAGHPNFRYKKVNIIMGANASGKTTLGRVLMKIFNFIDNRNHAWISEVIADQSREASFALDMASDDSVFYRISCVISPCTAGKYTAKDVHLEIRQENIRLNDSYESCVRRIEDAPYSPAESYLSELEKMGSLDWLFEYPEDSKDSFLFLPNRDEHFRMTLEHILKSLDPAIERVEISQEVDSAYVIRLHDKAIILQDGELFTTNLLSSGTKAGVEIAKMISALIQGHHSFYYCDEKFSYIHSDIEKAILALMIEAIHPNDQLFFTTHNAEILDMNLPKHAFTFLRKDTTATDCPITCVDASSLLKRSTDCLKKAVENDLFSTAPAVDLIYAISDL